LSTHRRFIAGKCSPAFFSLVLLAAGLTGCDMSSDVQQARALPVEVVQSNNEDVQLYLEMVGTMLDTQDIPIRDRVEGFLEFMSFAEGSYVEKGTLRHVIDDEPFLAKVVEAERQLARAKTSLAKSQADLSRIKPLAAMNAVSA